MSASNRHIDRGFCRRRAYTLLEVLVAMTMFALITVATSFALSAALRGQQATQQRTDDVQEARAILSVLSRDIRQAYASMGNPASLFVASGSDSGMLLTFTTLSHRITGTGVGAPNPLTSTQSDSQNDHPFLPQSDMTIVSYSLDRDNGVLTRMETDVPNTDLLQQNGGQQTPTPDTVLSRRVRSITFQYNDPNSGPRNDWNFTVQQPSAGGQGQTTNTDNPNGDTSLPQSVQITIELLTPNGPPVTYSTAVALAMPTPQPKGQQPATTTTTTGTGGSSGQNGGSNGSGGNNGGNNGGTPPRPGGGGTGGSLPGMPQGAGSIPRPPGG